MKRKDAFLLCVCVLILVFMVWAQSGLRAAGHAKLDVALHYTGTGIVDEQHRIYVLLTDTDPFPSPRLVQSDLPPTNPEQGAVRVVACLGIPQRDGTVTFHNLAGSRVYAIAFLDQSGSYSRLQESLPPGSPMGGVGKMPHKLETIRVEEGKTARVFLAFDDSRKTPSLP